MTRTDLQAHAPNLPELLSAADLRPVEARMGFTSLGLLEAYLELLPSEVSRRVQRRHARSVARELFKLADPVGWNAGPVDQRPTGVEESAEWSALTLPEAIRYLARYRSDLLKRVHERLDAIDEGKSGRDLPGISIAAMNARLSIIRGIARRVLRPGNHIGDEHYRSLRLATELLSKSYQHYEPERPPIDPKEFPGLRSATTRLGANRSRREMALLALLSLGMRRSEIANLKWSDEKSDSSGGMRFRFKGKGNKPRHVFLDAQRAAALTAWRKVSGNPASGPVLRRITREDRILDRAVSGSCVYHAVQKLLSEAGRPLRGAHAFRRMFATTALRELKDPALVMQLTGHSSLEVLMAYDQPDVEVIARAGRQVGTNLFAEASA